MQVLRAAVQDVAPSLEMVWDGEGKKSEREFVFLYIG